jgi:hypothetical protein
VRVLILTHRCSDASFRVRWERHRPALRERGVETVVHEIPPRGRGALWRAARDHDAVVLHRRLLRRTDLRRLRRHAARLVYDFDDALCFRPRPPHRSLTRRVRFFATVAASDLVFAGNRYLAALARLRARIVFVLPSTVEVADPPPGVVQHERFTAVWIGQAATLPHLELVRRPLLEAGIPIRVVADRAPEGTESRPWSEETEARDLAECHVGLMPLPDDPYARGKCGYKLLQYYAAGLPAVASPVGVNRVLAAGGALLAREPGAWIAALRRLEGDAGLRAALGASGRDFVERRYAAGPLAARLAHLLENA